MPGRRVSRDVLDVRPTPLSGPVRVARAGVLGGLSLLLATGAHLAGGGRLPGVGLLLVVAILLGLLAAVVTTRRCRFAVLALLLAGQQLALHELFSLAAAARQVTLVAPGSVHHGVHVLSTSTPGPGMAMAGDLPGWTMWAAHLAAVLATAWLLARGEAWLWRAVEHVAAAAGLAATRTALPHRPAGRSEHPAPLRRSSPGWRLAAPRGPPLALVG